MNEMGASDFSLLNYLWLDLFLKQQWAVAFIDLDY